MRRDRILEIVKLCLAIDKIAQKTYSRLADLCETDELCQFWHEMSRQEEAHVEFWQRLKLMGGRAALPEVFDDPDAVVDELREIEAKASNLLKQYERTHRVSDAFVVAYRLEFYLLHPAFEFLFHSMRAIAGEPNPEDEYETHINYLIDMLVEHGEVTPELELLGETLRRLWKENKSLAYQATRDYLTGLLNRRGFFSLATQLANLAQRNKFTIAVAMIDIDDFKAINDEHGHDVGDAVLKDTADVLTSAVRSSDIIGRYGGEEFIIFFPSTDHEAVGKIAEKIRGLVESSTPQGIRTTVSIGTAHGQIRSDIPKELQAIIRRADSALYAAKRGGKNRVVVGNRDNEGHP